MITPPATTSARRGTSTKAGGTGPRSSAGCASTPLDQPDAIAVVDETTDDRASATASSGHDACRVAAFLGDHGVRPGDVVSVQLPNWYETVGHRPRRARTRARCSTRCCRTTAPASCDHVLGTASTKLLFTPDEFRGFDHAGPRSATCTTSIDTARPPRRGPRRRRLLAARARSRTRRTSQPVDRPRGALGGDLHVGHRGHAEGRSCTPSRPPTSTCVRRTTVDRAHRRRRGVDAEPDRPLDRPQLRRALRALLRPALVLQDRWDADARGRADRARALLLHARRHHVPHRSRRRRATVGPRRVVAHPLRLWWRARAAGDRAAPAPTRASTCCGSTGSPRRSS